jgi:hypothetical protein
MKSLFSKASYSKEAERLLRNRDTAAKIFDEVRKLQRQPQGSHFSVDSVDIYSDSPTLEQANKRK